MKIDIDIDFDIDFVVNLWCEMFKFFLHDHLCFAPKPRKTSQYLIKTDFLEGNHVYMYNTSEQQLFRRNLGCYLHNFQFQMRCYGFNLSPKSDLCFPGINMELNVL